VDVYSLGRIMFVALLGTVTLEVALIARYWTWLFGIVTVLSYLLVSGAPLLIRRLLAFHGSWQSISTVSKVAKESFISSS
jgi:hypothetical protein